MIKHPVKRELDEQRKWFRMTLGNINDAVITTGPEDRVTYINTAMEALTGWHAEEAIGVDIDSMIRIVDEKSDRSWEKLKEPFPSAADNLPMTGFSTLLTKDGGSIPVEKSVSPILDVDGTAIGKLYVLHDITVRLRANEALKSAIEELEQFAYAASHDLREPLRAISGYLDLLQSRSSEQIDDKGRQFIEYALNATHRMQRMLHDLLIFSRLSTRDLRFDHVDLNEVANYAIDNIDDLIQKTGAKITWNDLPKLMTDSDRMQTLFVNLLANAVQYNNSPVPTVEIIYKMERTMCQISVKDNGIGIADRFYERIFMPFQRLHTEREYSGTGMGLAVCKKIVADFHGKIWVTSLPQYGSTFHLTLPRNKMKGSQTHP